MDSEKAEFVVSGSSARLLSREVHTSLRGRGMETVIRPFSFREFLRHRGEEPTKPPRRWTAAERSLVENRFREFLLGIGVQKPRVKIIPVFRTGRLAQVDGERLTEEMLDGFDRSLLQCAMTGCSLRLHEKLTPRMPPARAPGNAMRRKR